MLAHIHNKHTSTQFCMYFQVVSFSAIRVAQITSSEGIVYSSSFNFYSKTKYQILMNENIDMFSLPLL